MGKLYYYLLPINIGLTSTELKTNKSSVSILLNALEYTKGMTVDVLNIQIKGILSLSLSLQISCSSTDGHYSLLYPFPHLLSPSSILAMAVDSTLPNTFQIQPPSSDPLLPPQSSPPPSPAWAIASSGLLTSSLSVLWSLGTIVPVLL